MTTRREERLEKQREAVADRYEKAKQRVQEIEDAQRNRPRTAGSGGRGGGSRYPSRGGAALGRYPEPFTHNRIVESGGEASFGDLGLALLAAGLSATWTATRPTRNQQLGWGLFWVVAGGGAAIAGSGAFKYSGYGVACGNGAFVALRLFFPNLAA